MSIIDVIIGNDNTVNPGDEMILVSCADGYQYKLTEGKIYNCLNGLEEGIFYSRPFVSFIDDNGKKCSCHASRFIRAEDVAHYEEHKKMLAKR